MIAHEKERERESKKNLGIEEMVSALHIILSAARPKTHPR